MTRLTWRGQGGVVRWSYLQAAVLGPWTMSTEGTLTTITASVLTHNTYAVSQQPLTFEVSREGKAPWRWTMTGLQIVGGTLTASLVSQE